MKEKIRKYAGFDGRGSGKIFFAMLFTAVIIATAQVLALIAGGDYAKEALARSLADRQSSINWLYSVFMALTGFQAVRLADFSARAGHRFFWNAAGAAFLALSCSEICNLGEVTGWVFFPETSSRMAIVAVYGILAFLFVSGGWTLRSALDGSQDAAKMLLLASALFFAGHAGADFYLLTAQSTDDAVFSLTLFYTLKTLGTAGFFGSFVLHEAYLAWQMSRVEEGRRFEGIPTVKSENAAWTLRMIDTPVAGMEETEEEKDNTGAASRPAGSVSTPEK